MIADKVKIGEKSYKVTEIAAKACSGMEKLKKLTIKTKLLTEKSVGSSAFGGGSKKTVYKVPQEKLKAYRKLLVDKGVKSKKQVK